jgi:tetratricopeptide (TPR) repeat protein
MGKFSFGEAAYAAQPGLSWQTTVIGDPLYRPFAIAPQILHAQLERRQSKLIEWSHLRVCDLNEVTDLPARQLIKYLESLPVTQKSAILTEKLADYYDAIGKKESAAHSFEKALKLDPSPQQRVRLTFTLADRLTALDKESEAFDLLDQFYKESPSYADLPGLCQKLDALARKLNKPAAAQHYDAELKRLTPMRN